MKIFRIYIVCALLFGTAKTIGQETQTSDVLAKVSDFYTKSDTYKVQFEFTFKHGPENKTIQSYSGSLLKMGKDTKLNLLDTEIISRSDIHLSIDHSNKSMEYSSVSKKIANSPLDISAFLKNYELISTSAENNNWICELAPKMQHSQYPYKKVVLYIDKNTYALEKQILSFTNKIPYQEKDGSVTEGYAHLEIALSHDLHPEKEEIDINSYILPAANNRFTPSPVYKEYSITAQTK